jgi:hypothetical protein
MSSSNETDDYMSLSFVVDDKNLTTKKKQAPANINSGNKQQRKKQRRFNQQEQMDSSLKEGLNQPIECTNKGFKLLEKFGFKKEEGGLGKFGTGIQEPITIVPSLGQKSNLGIGKEKSLLEMHERFREKLAMHQRSMASLQSSFRHSLKYSQESKQLRRDIIQSEKIIEQLDERGSIERHELWPPALKEEINENHLVGIEVTDDNDDRCDDVGHSDDDMPQLLHKLELRLVYLRTEHNYCIYCGCAFEDIEDLVANCSGPLRDDH